MFASISLLGLAILGFMDLSHGDCADIVAAVVALYFGSWIALAGSLGGQARKKVIAFLIGGGAVVLTAIMLLVYDYSMT